MWSSAQWVKPTQPQLLWLNYSPIHPARQMQTGIGRFRTGLSHTTYKILLNFLVWWPQIKRNEVMFCFYTKYYGKVIYSNSQPEWFIIIVWNTWYNCHMSYGTQRNPPPHAPFFCLLYHKIVFFSRQSVDIIALSNDYETNLFLYLFGLQNRK